MPSPVRRSTRGALPQIKSAPPTSNSSSSSLSLGKPGRKPAGNLKSATPRSLSSEEPSEPVRRSQRAHQSREEEMLEGEGEEEAIAGEEDVTRCICGLQDYPGPPLSEAFESVDITQIEDPGALFIQCDGCSVWQHGGCVGIIEESQCPDKYYCEDCRPKQHDLHNDARGYVDISYRSFRYF